jgi:antitoxin component of RelBE/YafQ-DinJ toxin-antitoxin module|tara:strand:- start:263 stop:565 length:303 start_codon:yes stop_codon:yes gene_type:complete
MKTAVVNFKTTPEIKQKAIKKAKKAGVSLSFLLDRHMHEIASAKTLTLDFDAEEPSEMLIRDLKESEEDEKKGFTSPAFDNADDAIAWLEDPNAKYENQI